MLEFLVVPHMLIFPKFTEKKLDPKAKKLILVEYEKNSANYRLYDPITKKISISRDVIFNEEAVVLTDINSYSADAHTTLNDK